MAAKRRKLQKRLDARIKDWNLTMAQSKKKGVEGAYHKPGSMRHKG